MPAHTRDRRRVAGRRERASYPWGLVRAPTDIDYIDAVKALADDLARQGTDNFVADEDLFAQAAAALSGSGRVPAEDGDLCRQIARWVSAAAQVGVLAERFKDRP